MITRRTFLQTIGLATASFLIPGHRRNIDLMEFCGEYARHDYSLPHQVDDWIYATDSRMAVRVRPILADALLHANDRVPPFSRLPWDKSKLVWRPIQKPDPIVAVSICPQCGGSGYWPKPPAQFIVSCANCLGDGCSGCDDRGSYAHGYECSMCRGRMQGIFPSIVKVDDQYFDAGRVQKFYRMGSDYAIDPNGFSATPSATLLRFRFADGIGMLMPIRQDSAIERISEARS
ncbi:MAG TPA: hypothetical protein VGM05_22080 [Planctomycetaceae bacterium]|jgi:hypothetical protein